MAVMAEPRVLVGYSPDDRGEDALVLAALVAGTLDAPLTVAHVHPRAWPARGPASVDAEWVAFLRAQSQEAVDRAAERLAALGVRDVARAVHAHRGSGRGLIEVAGDRGAGLIVAGSAPRGRRGRIAIGSTADQLLHGAPVPVLLAPRGYAQDAPDRFERLTIAYWRGRGTDAPVRDAAAFGEALGLPVRLVTLVLRPAGLTARFRGAEDVVRRQLDRAEVDLEHAAGLLGPGARPATETVVGAGTTKALGAVDMLPGEMLACMSSHDGPLRKVFLGESSGKIVRAAPCPVLVLPRGTREGPRTAG